MLAEKYAYLEDRVPVMEPIGREKPIRREEPRSKPLPVQKPQTWKKVLTVGMVLVCFAAASFTVSRYAVITENHREILALEQALEKENLYTENLIVELSFGKDLGAIEFSATEMGMKYPGEGQVMFVDLPNHETSTVEQADASAVSTGGGFWRRFLGPSN